MSIVPTGSRASPLTPGASVGVVDGGIDVSEVDLAHESVDLQHGSVSEYIKGGLVGLGNSR